MSQQRALRNGEAPNAAPEGDGGATTTTTGNTAGAVFLASIEAKLRNPFTSLDLANYAEREVDPRAFLNDINKNAFDQHTSAKMDKIVKLRVLISLLGLEGSTRLSASSGDGDDIIWNILQNAQHYAPDDEEWTRMVAGIVQGIMYAKLTHDDDDEQQPEQRVLKQSRGEEIEKTFLRNNEKIIKDTLESWRATNTNNNNSTKDEIPLYVPVRFHLLDPPILRHHLPELYTNPHFSTSIRDDNSILQIDPKAEQIRAAEEERELESKRLLEEKKKIIRTHAITGRSNTNSVLQRGENCNTTRISSTQQQRPNEGGTESVQKPSSNASFLLRTSGLGRGRLASGVAGSSSAAGSNRVIGRGMSAAAKAALAMRDKTRTVAASATLPTTESAISENPPQTQKVEIVAPAATTTTLLGRATTAMKGRITLGSTSRMKVIDLADVRANMENVKRASDMEDSRALRKRKLMEEAEARGLKKSTKKPVTKASTNAAVGSNGGVSKS